MSFIDDIISGLDKKNKKRSEEVSSLIDLNKTSYQITLPKKIKCRYCSGEGRMTQSLRYGWDYGDTCPRCYGSGYINDL
jgi:DnaJ-class molecular chaperone